MKNRLQDLIARGNAFREDFLSGSRYRWYRHSAPNADYAGWKNDCLLFIRKAFGGESRYYTELAAVDNGNAMRSPGTVFSFFVSTLRRAQNDLAAAPVSARTARQTGLTEDLLIRAEDMVGKGHYVSAATLAGAVLEDLLRRLCAASGVFCAENATLENVNDRLLAAGVYDSAWHRETALRIGLRRTAEHCYIEKLNADNVSGMIAWLRGFSGRKFSTIGATAASRS